MILNNVKISGFRSFQEPAEINFDKFKGLVFVRGANGAGKSSIFEAIYWCLFGKTSRGLKAGSIRSWAGGKKTWVELAFKSHSNDYVLYRSSGPNVLTLITNNSDPAEIDQDALEHQLGTSAKAFLYSRFFAQFVPSFLDLMPNAQLDLFTEILKLDVWDAAADRAGKEASRMESDLAALTATLNRDKGKLIAVLEGIDATREKESVAYRDRYIKAVSVWASLNVQSHISDKATAAATKEQDKVVALRATISDDAEAARTNHRLLEKEQAVIYSQISSLEKQIEKLNDWKRHFGNTCPTCHQKVTKDHLDSEVRSSIQDLQKQITPLQKQEQSNTLRMSVLSSLVKQQQDSTPDMVALNAAVKNANEQSRRVEQLLHEMHAITASDDSWDFDTTKQEQQAEAIHFAVETSRNSISQQKSFVAGARYWQKEFKEIRLFLIEESLAQLEVEANSALHELGLPDWRIEFDIEKETKSGTIKRGFSTFIYSPINEELVPWEVWSGGESQRLSLAVTMGLSNLITNRIGSEIDVEFWDEPSTWLSTSGIADLMQTLKSRSETTQRQVWIADHRTLDYGSFDHVVSVTKNETGSHIELS